MIQAMELHFSDISSVLDTCGIPTGVGGKPFTVLQRVMILAGCMKEKKPSKRQIEKATWLVSQFEENTVGPEDIMEMIGTETFEERMIREGVMDGRHNSNDLCDGEPGGDHPDDSGDSHLIELDRACGS